MNYMHYRSTRGGDKKTFEEILSSGLAENGGLYEPLHWPRKRSLQRFLSKEPDFAQVVGAVVGLFAGKRSLPQLNFTALARKAFEPFASEVVVPLREVERNLWLLELFHGPTLSFKDIPLQFYGQLLEALSAQRRRLLIMIGATSGDTGSAAIEAMRNVRGVRLFMLYPKDGISEQQRRQMTCVQAPHICNIAVDGSYDDCLRLVKAAAQAEEIQARGQISAVNSFNWVRIAVQSAVYLYAAQKMRSSAHSVDFALASGNFGNAYAGYVAKQLGAKISTINLAVGRNDFLHSLFQNAEAQPGEVTPSLAPSIDIMTPNNVERLLYRALGAKVRRWTKQRESSQKSGTLAVPKNAMRSEIFRMFRTQRFEDEQILEAMKQAYESIGIPLDPHSAIALVAAKNARKEASMRELRDKCTVAFATASAAKFPQTVERAIGAMPHIPPKLQELEGKEEHFESIPAEENALLEVLVARLRTPLDTDESAPAEEEPASTAATAAPVEASQQAQEETATQDDANEQVSEQASEQVSEQEGLADGEGVEEPAENQSQKSGDEKENDESPTSSSMLSAFEETNQQDGKKENEESSTSDSVISAFASGFSATTAQAPAVSALTDAEDSLEKKIAMLKKQTAQLDEGLEKPLTNPSSFVTSSSPSSFEMPAEQESPKMAKAEEDLPQPSPSVLGSEEESFSKTAFSAPDVPAAGLTSEDSITSLADAAEQGQVSLQEKINKLKEQSAKLDEPIGVPTADGVLAGAEPFFSKPASVSDGDTSVSADTTSSQDFKQETTQETTQDISGILPVEEESQETTQDISGILPVEEEAQETTQEPTSDEAAESADSFLQDAGAEKSSETKY